MGRIERQGFSIEVGMSDDPVKCIAFHVHGGGGAAEVVADVLDHLHLRALDMQTGDFFSRSKATQSFEDWQSYRDAAILRDRPEG